LLRPTVRFPSCLRNRDGQTCARERRCGDSRARTLEVIA
jgi:hypothetical protein